MYSNNTNYNNTLNNSYGNQNSSIFSNFQFNIQNTSSYNTMGFGPNNSNNGGKFIVLLNLLNYHKFKKHSQILQITLI